MLLIIIIILLILWAPGYYGYGRSRWGMGYGGDILTLLLIIVNFRSVLGIFGTRGILGGLLFIAISFGIGWFLGGPDPDGRRVVALGTAQRNIAAAIVVGGQSFTDPKVVVMVVVVAIVGLLILMPLSPRLAT